MIQVQTLDQILQLHRVIAVEYAMAVGQGVVVNGHFTTIVADGQHDGITQIFRCDAGDIYIASAFAFHDGSSIAIDQYCQTVRNVATGEGEAKGCVFLQKQTTTQRQANLWQEVICYKRLILGPPFLCKKHMIDYAHYA